MIIQITEGNSNKYQEISINHDGSAITTLTIQGTDSSYWGIGGIMVNGTTEPVDSTNTSLILVQNFRCE